MSEPSNLLYTPLKGDQIRVIHLTSTSLVDADGGAPHQDLAIICEMRIVSLGDVEAGKESYYALSYCWGSQQHRRHVICNGVPLTVTRNLYNVLWHCLFDGDEPSQTLWVDAICINQEDNAERGQQVSLMRKIYQQADSALVWLGTGEDLGTGEIFDYWQWLAGGAEPAQRPSERAVDLGQDYILRSSWFRRAWTFQEIVLPRQAVMRCGMYTFGWDVLSRQPAFESLIGGIEGLRRGSGQAKLTSLLKLTQNRQSTDPRDRLYALLGMYSGSADIRPDYSRSLRDVLRIIADVVIHDEANLSVLGLAKVPILHMKSSDQYVLVSKKPVKVVPKPNEDDRTMLMLGHDDDYEKGDNYLIELPVDVRKYVESVHEEAVTNKPWTTPTPQPQQHHRGRDWHPDFLDISASDVLEYMHEKQAHETTYNFQRIHQDFKPSFHDRDGHLVARGLILGRWIPLLRHVREKIWRRPDSTLIEVMRRDEFDNSKTTGVVLPLPPCVDAALARSRATIQRLMKALPAAAEFPKIEDADIARLSGLCRAHDARKCACDGVEWPVLAELVPANALQFYVFMPFGAAAPLVVLPDCYEDEAQKTVKLVARCKGFDSDVHWPLRHAAYDRDDNRLRSSEYDPRYEVNLSCVMVGLEIANETAEMPPSTFPGRERELAVRSVGGK